MAAAIQSPLHSRHPRDGDSVTLPRNKPPASQILIKPPKAICNLDSDYCFSLSKEMLHPGSRCQMAERRRVCAGIFFETGVGAAYLKNGRRFRGFG
jgi:hypothetical protein